MVTKINVKQAAALRALLALPVPAAGEYCETGLHLATLYGLRRKGLISFFGCCTGGVVGSLVITDAGRQAIAEAM